MKLFFIIIAIMITAISARAQVKGTSAPMRIVPKTQAGAYSGAKLTPPVISISSPLPGKGTKVISSQAVVSVKGTALSLNGVRLVTVNRQRAILLEDGSFSADVGLKTGDNALVISATDSRGNTATETLFVTRR
ncbi:MAG: hypothetical protein HF300_04520 [Ignavibacteria bacterium]|jgi:hypothetical protein|nr:hypothetical protein [Ignavibacteria bacterium]HEX2963661.1 hypothetical protein [Ignavibacteriales bacterium]MCU7500683.1 hypothetical protein [Ignavibacteria bacterium]MCU7511800.1 hypothetical protein [Ignavibacteria bacterium]MCU7520702.1 hypothetical protein [Ignavibacteria bacterium]